MAKSYKKHPRCGDKKGTVKKRMAWKAVRQWCKDHPDESLKGNQYKKIYETYDICDYNLMTSWEEYWASCQRLHNEAIIRGCGLYKEELDEKKEYRWWYTHYKNK